MFWSKKSLWNTGNRKACLLLKKQITALSKYNLHAIQFIHLKSTFQGSLVYSQFVQTSPLYIPEHFHCSNKKKKYSLEVVPHFPPKYSHP